MVSIREQVDIRADVESTFAYVDDRSRSARLRPAFPPVRSTDGASGANATMEYNMRILAIPFSGTATTTDYQPHERIIWSLQGALRGTVRWYFEPLSSKTRFTVAATLRASAPSLFRRALAPLLHRRTRQQIRRFLQKTKRRVEADAGMESV